MANVRSLWFRIFVSAGLGALSLNAAQAQFGGPAQSPRDAAPFDLEGQWVAVVTEDWRFRMVTPPRGDFPGLPLNAAARAVAGNWDPAADEAAGDACKAYGAGGIMRMPARLRIDWASDGALTIRIDAGRQIRRLEFDADALPDAAEPTLQGVSLAEWEIQRGGRGGPPVNGSLKVVTTGMQAGHFRKNGVPYSEEAVLTEYFDLLTQHDGSEWLVVLSILEDPVYYTQPVITSSNFRREDDRGAWSPSDCSAY